MSLDVMLYFGNSQTNGSGIFVRDNGTIREITRAEWDEKFPNEEPVVTEVDNGGVFSDNITHNLGGMADEAGIYKALWRPEEIDISNAYQLIQPLTDGLTLLKSDPDRFRVHNPENGWGSYESLVQFVENYLKACKQYPTAIVSVSR